MVTPELVGRFRGAKRVLFVTHERPDGDALGSTCGMRACLRAAGREAELLVPGELPHRYRRLCGEVRREMSAAKLDGFDLVASFDCANVARLSLPSGITIEMLRERNFVNLDHHAGNNIEAGINCVVPTASSTSFLASRLAVECGFSPTPEAATLFLAGMMTDTGCFRFSNTDPATLRRAAELLEAGANLETVANEVFFSKPRNYAAFEADLMANHLRFGCGGRFAYANITPELLAAHNFDLREDEGVIDLLRELEGVVAAMLIHRNSAGAYKVSLRSKERRFPVGPLARRYGGGGHDLAAGLTLHVADFAEADALMEREIAALLDGPGVAANEPQV